MSKYKNEGIHLKIESSYREKDNCLKKAEELILRNDVKDMTERKLAKEIFAHAVAYYKAEKFKNIPVIGEKVYNYLIKHANPIDIVDGGDTLIRRIEYNIVWFILSEHV